MRWNSGDHIVPEMKGNGLPFRVFPATVVSDSADLLAFYIRANTLYLRLVTADEHDLPRIIDVDEIHRMPKRLVRRSFGERHRLVVATPSEAYAVDTNWTEPGWNHVEWYVNMQTPFVRTALGFRTTDQVLDIVVQPDRSWKLKDVDEMAASVVSGRLTSHEGATVRGEAERVIRDIEAWQWPFNAKYEEWRPPQEWTIPTIPAEWMAKAIEL